MSNNKMTAADVDGLDISELVSAIIERHGWPWRPGMRVTYPSGHGVYLQTTETPPIVCIPDITDGATAGAMLDVLSQAEPDLELASFRGLGLRPWSACASPSDTHWYAGTGATMGEALARLVLLRGGWR